MAEGDPLATQRGLIADIPAELRGEGFDEVEEIGRGGFGVVYRCAQPTLDRTVAVKVLNSDSTPRTSNDSCGSNAPWVGCPVTRTS